MKTQVDILPEQLLDIVWLLSNSLGRLDLDFTTKGSPENLAVAITLV